MSGLIAICFIASAMGMAVAFFRTERKYRELDEWVYAEIGRIWDDAATPLKRSR